jgi:hypothetical protein
MLAGIPLSLLLGGGVALPDINTLGMSFFT